MDPTIPRHEEISHLSPSPIHPFEPDVFHCPRPTHPQSSSPSDRAPTAFCRQHAHPPSEEATAPVDPPPASTGLTAEIHCESPLPLQFQSSPRIPLQTPPPHYHQSYASKPSAGANMDGLPPKRPLIKRVIGNMIGRSHTLPPSPLSRS